jgi:hypothetical protein
MLHKFSLGGDDSLQSKVLWDALPWLVAKGPKEVPKFLRDHDPALLEALRKNRLTPLLYKRFIQCGMIKVDPSLYRWLEHDYALGLRNGHCQDQEALAVIQALTDSGIDLILLKGADLRLRVYGDAAVRPMADLDILISPQQLWQAKAAMGDLGYRLSPNSLDPRPGYRQRFGHALDFNLEKGRSLAVDLHWRILAAGDFYRLSYSSLRPRAVPYDYHDSPVWLLAPEHLLLHLCLRVYNDSFSLFLFIDLALAISKLNLDWSLFLHETTNFHCQYPAYIILRELARLCPRAVPGLVLAELARYQPRWYERVALSYRMRCLTLNFPMLYQHYPPREWASYYWGKLWPEPAYLAANYGRPDRIAYLQKSLTMFFSSDMI